MNILDPQGPIGAADKSILIDSLAIMLAIVGPTILAIFGFAWWYRASNARARYLPDWAYSGRIELVVWGKSVTADPIEIYRHGFFSARSRAARPIWDREHDPLIYVADPSGSCRSPQDQARFSNSIKAFFSGATKMADVHASTRGEARRSKQSQNPY